MPGKTRMHVSSAMSFDRPLAVPYFEPFLFGHTATSALAAHAGEFDQREDRFGKAVRLSNPWYAWNLCTWPV